MSKKIVLFIVEGRTEKISLELPLTDLLDSDKVLFKITEGDITSDYTTSTVANILETIVSYVEKFLNDEMVYASDILEIIQIVDLDGVYIDERYVVYHDNDKVIYGEEQISSKHPDKINVRNVNKALNLNMLKRTESIYVRNTKINYSVYFMSSNLDHVLHDNANLDDRYKMAKAESFADAYVDSLGLSGFIDFFKSVMIDDNDNYEQSWNRATKNKNSLKRSSNFYVFLKESNHENR